MAKGKTATLKEVRWAQQFLKYLGVNWRDTGLIIAVVAWMTVVSGRNLSNMRGRNALMVRPGVLAAASIPTRLIAGRFKGEDGNWYFKFRSVDDSLKAAAIVFKAQLSGTFLRQGLQAARRERPGDFLLAIALSNWDAHQYGLDPSTNGNRLWKMFSTFTGLTLPGTNPKQPPKVRPAPPPLPRDLRQPAARPDYLDGWAVVSFYQERIRRAEAGGALPS